MFLDDIQIICDREAFQFRTIAADEADISIIKFQSIFRSDQSEVAGWEHGELVDVLHVLFGPILHDLQADLQGCNGCISALQNAIAFLQW